MKIIPAIDILDGMCVRLLKGDYQQATFYPVSPLVYAQKLADAGMEHLHLVDLEGARSSHFTAYDLLQDLANGTTLKIDVGGGVRTLEVIEKVLDKGASQINLGSVAQQQPEKVVEWANQVQKETIIVGADVREGLVATHGWLAESNTRVEELIAFYVSNGFEYFTVTDISKDGTLKGPAIQLYKDILQQFPDIKLVASGGVSSLSDLDVLAETGCFGAIVGKALFEGHIPLPELGLWQTKNN